MIMQQGQVDGYEELNYITQKSPGGVTDSGTLEVE